jgi:ubiquinone/menaquinone biosynthesis C-methylase UbiE
MDNNTSQWQTEELSRTYLKGVRGAIPAAKLQIEVMLKIIRAWSPTPRNFIDLGCGDGIPGRQIVENFPGVYGWFIDFSTSMLKAVHKNVERGNAVTLIEADFSTPAWLQHFEDQTSIDLIVSGFAIHHQTDKRKREIYSEVFKLLSPGGVFLNLEHVASATTEIEALFDDYFIDYLYAFHRQAGTDESRDEIAQVYYLRPDKKENILTPVEVQCEWLREIGFRDVDCFFKVLELALFGGRKIVQQVDSATTANPCC